MPTLSPLRAEDLDALVRLQEAGAVIGLGHIFPQGAYPFPIAEIRESWRRDLADPAVDCFAVLAAGRLAGFAATRGDEFLHFGTAVETWGSGLADRAHAEVLDHLRAPGHQRAWLRVFEANERAIRFYVRRGWERTEHVTRTSFPPHPVLRHYERDLL